MWPLILTTEEISEIEDKGLALSIGNQGISFLTHLAVLSLSLSLSYSAPMCVYIREGERNNFKQSNISSVFPFFSLFGAV